MGGNFEIALAYLTRNCTKNTIKKYGPILETNNLPFVDDNTVSLNGTNFNVLNYYPTAINFVANIAYPSTPDYLITKSRVEEIKRLVEKNNNVIVSYRTSSNFDRNGIDHGTNYYKLDFSSTNKTQYHYNNYYGSNANSYGNHMVEIVGWDDNVPASAFSQPPPHNGAFIAKNSYGNYYSYYYPYYTSDGFIYISYDEADWLTDIRSFQTISDLRNIANIYENDYLGYTGAATLNNYQNGLEDQNTLFTLSKFDTAGQGELLTKVRLYIADKDTGFKVFVSCTGDLNDLYEVPVVTDNNFKKSDTYADYYCCKNYAGSYVIDLARACYISGSTFYIGIEYKKNGGNIILPVEKSDTQPWDNGIIVANPENALGHSFILKKSDNGNYLLAKNNINNYVDVNTINTVNKRGDFCIKAYTEACDMDILSDGFYNIQGIAAGGDIHTRSKMRLSNNCETYFFGTKNNPVRFTQCSPSNYGTKTFCKEIILQNNNRVDFRVSSNKRVTLSLRGGSSGANFKLYNANTGDLIGQKYVGNTITDIFYDYRGTGNILSLEFECDDDNSTLELFGIEVSSIPLGNGNYLDDIWNISTAPIVNSNITGANGQSIVIGNQYTNKATIENCNQTLNGIKYTKCIKLKGESELHKGCIELCDVPHNSYIDIIARVEDNGEEPVGLFIDNWITTEGITNIHQYAIHNDIRTYRYYYTGDTQALRLSLRGGSVKIYSIAIQTRVNNNSKVDRIIDFDSADFLGLTTIANNISAGGVNFYASPTKNLKIKHSGLTFDDIKHRRCLCFKGEGANGLRQIGVPVEGTCDIKIIAKSNDDSYRNLLVTDKHNNLLDSVSVSPVCGEYMVSTVFYSAECEANETPHSYVGAANEIFIKAEDSAINIYAVIIDNNSASVYNVNRENFVESFDIDTVVSGAAIQTEKSINYENANSEDIADLSVGEEIATETTTENNISDHDNERLNDINVEQNETYNLHDYSFLNTLSNNRTSSSFNYYEQLNSIEKNLYDSMETAYCDNGYGNNIIQFNANFDISTQYSAANVSLIRKSLRKTVTAFINDHPEIFWLDNKYHCIIKKYTYNNNDYIGQVSIIIQRYNGGFNNDDSVLTEATQLNNSIDDLVNDAENQSYHFNADYLQLKAIFDTMVDNYTYTNVKTSGTLNLHNSFGTLVGEYGSCTGLSKAFKTVCDQTDFVCITAKVVNNQNTTHICNLVNMNGEWYMVDLAAAIVNYNNSDDYFMVPLASGYTLINNTVYTAETDSFTYPQLSSYSYLHLMGDVTLDNNLTNEDAQLVMAYVLNEAVSLTTRQKLLADIDNDGVITADDALQIYQMILSQGNNRYDPQTAVDIISQEAKNEMVNTFYNGVNRIFYELRLPEVSREQITESMEAKDCELKKNLYSGNYNNFRFCTDCICELAPSRNAQLALFI